MSGDRLHVSVVIPTYNRRDRLAHVLLALAEQQEAEPYEVIVVSDGSSDGTDEYLAGDDVPLPVLALRQHNQGPAAARNLGVDRARGELIVFVDDDVVAGPTLIRAHRDAHVGSDGDLVVIGPMLDPPDHVMSPWVRWEQRMLAKQYGAMSNGDFEPTYRQFYTGNASVMRARLTRAGGFDPRYRRAEDIEFAIRADHDGARFVFEPAAEGFHYAERTFDAWLNIARSYGRLEVEFSRGVGGDPELGFVTEKFDEQHSLVRGAIKLTLRVPRVVDAVVPRTARIIRLLDRYRVTSPLAQSTLSFVYAVEYWRALSDAAGGADAMYAAIDHMHATRRSARAVQLSR